MLQSNKTIQNTDIPTNINKDNADIFMEFVFTRLNKYTEQSIFLSKLKLANVTPVHRKNTKVKKRTTDLSVFYQNFLKY